MRYSNCIILLLNNIHNPKWESSTDSPYILLLTITVNTLWLTSVNRYRRIQIGGNPLATWPLAC